MHQFHVEYDDQLTPHANVSIVEISQHQEAAEDELNEETGVVK